MTDRHLLDRETDAALARRPRHTPSPELLSRVRARAKSDAKSSRNKPQLARFALGTGVAALALAAAALVHVKVGASDQATERFEAEAVNDHLRILYAEHPLDVPSGGVHQVRPWFEGKVDFAPTHVFEGDDDLPMQGGSVALFQDRKAAAFVYKRKLHLVTLFVMRAQGLAWPTPDKDEGRVRVHFGGDRGFATVSWIDGDLGYVLVSDVDKTELDGIVAKMTR